MLANAGNTQLRNQINSEIQAFVNSGGVIDKIPPEICAEKYIGKKMTRKAIKKAVNAEIQEKKAKKNGGDK